MKFEERLDRSIYQNKILTETELNPGEYSNNVTLTIYSDTPNEYEIEAPRTIKISFDLDIDIRSWGIKEINIITRGIIQIEYYLTSEKENLKKTIAIDLEKIPKDTQKSDSITIGELNITITNNTIDYKRSNLTIYR